jgi:drug/metabolite transporter (DMT)-like permease
MMAVPETTDSRFAALGILAAIAAVTSWGIGPVVVKATDLPGVTVSFYRLVLGAGALTVILHLRGGRVTWPLLRASVPGGLAFAGDILLFFTAVKLTTVADATVISALQPALVLLVVGRLFGERVRRVDILWTALAILGVGVVVFASGQVAGRSLAGDLLATASLGAWSWYFVAAKQARRTYKALEYQTGIAVVAAVVAAPVTAVSGKSLRVPDAHTWGLLLLAITIGVAGHFLMVWAHGFTPLMVTSLLTLGSPVVSVVAAALFLGEPILLGHVVGMVIVIGSLAMVLVHTASSARRARALEGLEEVI